MAGKKTSGGKGSKTVEREVYPMAPGNPYANVNKKSTPKKNSKKK